MLKEILYQFMKTKMRCGMVTVSDIAKIVGGEVVGEGSTKVTGMASAWAAKEGDVTFAYDAAGIKEASESRASCILTTVEADKSCKKTVLKVKDMKKAMTILYNAMLEMTPPAKGETHPTAVIAKSARLGRNFTCGPHAVIGERAVIGDNVSVGANSVVGDDVTIGDSSRLYPNVTIYSNNDLGKRVIIHSGSVIGADGFGYVPQGEKIYKVPQMGKVVVEDDVEIGANACIDRGTFTITVIGRGTKIDNLVQIAHNVTIGRNVLIAAQTGISGSTIVGDGTIMGGQVGVADHVKIGRNVKAGGQTGITGHVGDNEVVFGYPHRPADEARKWHGLQSILIKHERNLRKFLKGLSDKEAQEGQK